MAGAEDHCLNVVSIVGGHTARPDWEVMTPVMFVATAKEGLADTIVAIKAYLTA